MYSAIEESNNIFYRTINHSTLRTYSVIDKSNSTFYRTWRTYHTTTITEHEEHTH